MKETIFSIIALNFVLAGTASAESSITEIYLSEMGVDHSTHVSGKAYDNLSAFFTEMSRSKPDMEELKRLFALMGGTKRGLKFGKVKTFYESEFMCQTGMRRCSLSYRTRDTVVMEDEDDD